MFQGFSQNAIDFLWGISLNNERGWFMAHKQDFTDYVDVPMRELGKEVFSALAEEYPKQDWRLHVCRIYRDARRLHGRGPYKEHLWFTIERPHERFESVPALYFELAPNYYSYGCGYWDAGAATMAKLRARIDNDPKPLERLARRLNKSKFVLSGEEFKLTLFRNGYIGVEFFFLLSGFLMAKSIYRRQSQACIGKLQPEPVGVETIRFLWGKVKALWPYYLPACAIGCLLFLLTKENLHPGWFVPISPACSSCRKPASPMPASLGCPAGTSAPCSSQWLYYTQSAGNSTSPLPPCSASCWAS